MSKVRRMTVLCSPSITERMNRLIKAAGGTISLRRLRRKVRNKTGVQPLVVVYPPHAEIPAESGQIYSYSNGRVSF